VFQTTRPHCCTRRPRGDTKLVWQQPNHVVVQGPMALTHTTVWSIRFVRVQLAPSVELCRLQWLSNQLHEIKTTTTTKLQMIVVRSMTTIASEVVGWNESWSPPNRLADLVCLGTPHTHESWSLKFFLWKYLHLQETIGNLGRVDATRENAIQKDLNRDDIELKALYFPLKPPRVVVDVENSATDKVIGNDQKWPPFE
jgi:hypothetical protein